MSNYMNQVSVRRLQNAVKKFRDVVPRPASHRWKRLSDSELWAAVLGQIAVVGSANSGDLLKKELSKDLQTWFDDLAAAAPGSRMRLIHARLRRAGVRYVTESSKNCKKSRSAAYDFDLLAAYGGPYSYFEKLSKIPDEAWRVGILSDEFQYIRSKGARDLLIGLGLVENAIALDSRLQTVLRNVGAEVPPDLAVNRVKYKSLERELLDKVCVPCAITGAHLDRILFSKWKEIL